MKRTREENDIHWDYIHKERGGQHLIVKTENHDRIKKCVDLMEKKSLLDIAGGDGFVCSYAKKIIGMESAVNLDFKVAAIIGSGNGIPSISCDMDESGLPIADNSIEQVFCGDALDHFCDHEYILEEIYRVLKKDGVFIISVANLESYIVRLFMLFGFKSLTTLAPFEPDHLHTYTQDRLTKLLESKGFKVEKVDGSIWQVRNDRIIGKLANKFFSATNFLTRIRPKLFGYNIIFKCRK